MRWSWFSIITAFGVGFVLGWSISLSLNPQTAAVGNAGIILGAISTGVTVLRLFNDWSNEPTLEFGKITVNNEPAYFLEVKKRGKGQAEECEGWIEIGDIHAPSVWALNEPRIFNIAESMGLRLFRIDRNNDCIVFPSASLTGRKADNPRPYNEYINKLLKVRIYAKKGRTPKKAFTRTIVEIINKSSNL
jgi:hypothetical protein